MTELLKLLRTKAQEKHDAIMDAIRSSRFSDDTDLLYADANSLEILIDIYDEALSELESLPKYDPMAEPTA